MTPLLTHVWGESKAADRVWAQVAGLRPNLASGRLLMALQAFIDDSYTPDGVFVLAGHVASAEAWAAFAREWEEMLPHGVLDRYGKHHFKMAEMASNPERMARVAGFYRLIEKHVALSVSCRFDVRHLRQAQSRLWLLKRPIHWEPFDNPYIMAFRCLVDGFHNYRPNIADILPLDQKVDFFFDEQTEKKMILSSWDSYMDSRPPETRGLYGTTPRFESDNDFLPLQAADLWAWWVRYWGEREPDKDLTTCDFGMWSGRPDHMKLAITYDEDGFVEAFRQMVQEQLEPGEVIYDSAFSRVLKP
jgi:hypothetical protein